MCLTQQMVIFKELKQDLSSYVRWLYIFSCPLLICIVYENIDADIYFKNYYVMYIFYVFKNVASMFDVMSVWWCEGIKEYWDVYVEIYCEK